MVEITWSKFALKDLDSIYDFVSNDSEVYARKLVETIIFRVGALADFTELGRVVPEFNNATIRELIYGNYRIVYKLKTKSVVIVRVHHSAMILKKGSK